MFKQATQAEYDKLLAEAVALRAKVLRVQDDLHKMTQERSDLAAENMRLANRVSELNEITRNAEIMVPRGSGMTLYGRGDLGYD